MPEPACWIIPVVLGGAAFVQSATGFGLAIVCMAALPLVMPTQDAATVTALVNLVVCAGVIFSNRSGLRSVTCWPLLLAICLGIPAGFYLLRGLDEVWLKRILGVVLISLSFPELLFSRRTFAFPEIAGPPVCFLGGVLGGAFNVGGPPIVAYVYSRDWGGKVATVAVIQVIFLTSGLIRNLLMMIEGDTRMDLIKWVMLSIPTVALGIWLGKMVLDRTPMYWLKRTVFIAVFFIGIGFLFSRN